MENMKTNLVNAASCLLIFFLCALSITSCSEETLKVPTNWVTLPEGPLTVSYEGGKLTHKFTLANELNPSYVYVISGDEWCTAYVDKGSEINITVDASTVIVDRTSTLTLAYDEQHKVEISVTQEAAPPTMISEIKFPAEVSGQVVDMGKTFDLNKMMQILPAHASNQTLEFTIVEGADGVVSLVDGILKTLKTGTVKIKASATDGSGISAEAAVTVGGRLVHERAKWTVSTNIVYKIGNSNHVPDGETGKPEHILDNDLATYLSLTKPGKNYDGYATPADYVLSFTVDMKKENEFNFIQWGHRSSNSYDFLRVWSATLYGSHDGENFTEIQKDITIDRIAKGVFDIGLNKVFTYRYIKVEYTDWSKTSGSTMQVAEFGVGMSF